MVLCGLWHPLDPDLVVTGSGDSTVRVWRVSAQSEGQPPVKKKAKSYHGVSQALPDKSFDVSEQRTEKASLTLAGRSLFRPPPGK